jgi:hypothetical protein
MTKRKSIDEWTEAAVRTEGRALQLSVDAVYDRAAREHRTPPTVEAAVKEAIEATRHEDAIAANAIAAMRPSDWDLLRQRLRRPGDTEDQFEFEMLKFLRHFDGDRALRATYHHALDRWLDGVYGKRRTGRPRISKKFAQLRDELATKFGAGVVASKLDVSSSALKKQDRSQRKK